MKKKELTEILVRRSKELRIENDLTIAELENLMGLGKNIYSYFEQAQGGQIETLLTIINYWIDQGYNASWLVTRNNDNIYKKEEHQIYMDIDIKNHQKDITEISKLTTELNKKVSLFEKKIKEY